MIIIIVMMKGLERLLAGVVPGVAGPAAPHDHADLAVAAAQERLECVSGRAGVRHLHRHLPQSLPLRVQLWLQH